MDCIYTTLSQTEWPPKRFTFFLTFTHSYTTNGGVSHTRRHPARREQQLGFRCQNFDLICGDYKAEMPAEHL